MIPSRKVAPVGDGVNDGAFISIGYDATTHKRITGKDLDLSKDDAAQADTSG